MAQSKPVSVMHIIDNEDSKVIVNDYKNIDKIFLHPEVADRKVVVFTTIGAFRKGKSFLLDYCLRFLYANYRTINNSARTNASWNWLGSPEEPLKGFSWKPGRKADTKGIIMWSDVFLHDTPTEKLAIVVMDTQGLFENGSTTKENSRIFGLSTLIASIQVINLQDLVQEDHLEYLGMATSLSQMVLDKTKVDGASNSKMFQKLIFLIRDWRDDGIDLGYEGGKIYLEEFLSGTNYRSKEAQSVRQHIQESFENIQCCLLPYPGEAVSKTSFDGHHGALNTEFVENLKMFIESILKPENLVKKSILGREVTGKEFRDYIHTYFEAFRSNDIPNVESIFKMTIERQVETLLDECIKVYEKEIRNSFINSYSCSDYKDCDEFVSKLKEINEEAQNIAIQMFKPLRNLSENREADLKEKMDLIYKEWSTNHLKDFTSKAELIRQQEELRKQEEEIERKMRELEEQHRKEREENEAARQRLEEERRRAEELKRMINLINSRGCVDVRRSRRNDCVIS